ncbi:arabinogalactan oligomer / maltooligosaccharide transport system permease protein [Candidatus Hakubella thermalkaliphila]|uniref:Arabinogalactan oligomer / maltooligosaccharide transport system permease protein n=2 Tax=Candidatus Hakubella thermalkaliphila TaxID=2754717 RepID=A0A6V8PC07_9ACTN|nr:arabinogalactan oligomer / maltooligosaccharide transport system permease protein [Candidatus Hakubella thermalkaliphila]GFP30249.1 arabinogalactan oligomer / maltooligosaccharide transport system permease protein [Candidatus Hakubella thermalkaliphila]GFP37690.1 arabinogalactan oligomer / maltooligosaccharide transport system permease protein [Candidatus Hakubella thermalkaliphila]
MRSEMSDNSSTSFVTRLAKRFKAKPSSSRRLGLGPQLLLQLIMFTIAASVMYPLLWVISLSLDPRNILRPTELRLIPPGATLENYRQVFIQPTPNPVSLSELALNSFSLSIGTAIVSVLIGVFAAYAFSRRRFAGRQALMISVLAVLMLPAIATLPALFVLLNRVQISIGEIQFNLRNSLWGVSLAVLSGLLPFAIWNLKGYLDTIPKDLEEAALIDGCTRNQAFFRVTLPLAVPALAVTGFLGFMATWSEFAISWQFLTNPKDFTLAMGLYNMVGQFAGSVSWSRFSAMAILFALPVSVVYLYLQKYIVSGLAIGGVKG